MNIKEIHRNDAICSYTILPSSPEVFVVPDTSRDFRFAKSVLVTGVPNIKFYAGAALVVAGVRVGTLCIMDIHPRDNFDLSNRMNLLDLGEAVSSVIREKRENNLHADRERTKLLVDTMHNVRTPLMSLGMASTMLADDRQRITRIIKNSNEVDCTQLAANFNDTVDDIVSSFDELKLTVESTFSLSTVMLENFQASKDGRVRPVPCDLLQRVQSVQHTLSEIHSANNLEWDIDSSKLSLGTHVSHPDAVTFILFSTLSKVVLSWNHISVKILFEETPTLSPKSSGSVHIDDHNHSSHTTSNRYMQNEDAIIGALKLIINMIGRKREHRFSMDKNVRSGKFSEKKVSGDEDRNSMMVRSAVEAASRRYSEFDIDHKAINRIVTDVGGSRRESVDPPENHSNDISQDDVLLLNTSNHNLPPTETLEYKIPCVIVPHKMIMSPRGAPCRRISSKSSVNSEVLTQQQEELAQPQQQNASEKGYTPRSNMFVEFSEFKAEDELEAFDNDNLPASAKVANISSRCQESSAPARYSYLCVHVVRLQLFLLKYYSQNDVRRACSEDKIQLP